MPKVIKKMSQVYLKNEHDFLHVVIHLYDLVHSYGCVHAHLCMPKVITIIKSSVCQD